MRKSIKSLSNYFVVRPRYKDVDYVPNVDRRKLLRNALLGMLGGAGIGALLSYKSDSNLAKYGVPVSLGLAGALLAAGGSGIYDAVQGRSYDYNNYKVPKGSGKKVIIGVSGGGSAPGGVMDKTLSELYGGDRVAMFNWKDRDRLEKFVKSLPKDIEIEAHGWSYGGSTLANLVHKLKDRRFSKVFTYDPVSRLDITNKATDNVDKWVNVLPGDKSLFSGGNYIARIGGVWGDVLGAKNVTLPKVLNGKPTNHSSFGDMLEAAITA